MELYNGFYFLQNFNYNKAQENFQNAYLKYRDLSKIDDKNYYNIDLFKINSNISHFFKENISSISNFIEKDDVENANKIIYNYFSSITFTKIKSNFQLERHIKSLKTLKFNKDSKIISQFKSENPINFCSSPPKVINKKILDDTGNIIIEWDKNSNLVKSNSILISKELKQYFLEVRFDNKEKTFEFSHEINTETIKVASISTSKIKAGLSSYKILLKSEKSSGEENIIVILTENNICGFQIICQIPIIIRNQEIYQARAIQYKTKTFDDFFSDFDSEIAELADKYSQFDHIEGKRINIRRIKSWLKQFGTLERAKLGLNILKNVNFYDRNRLKSCFEWLHKNHLSNKKFIIHNLGNLRDSSAIMSNIVSGDILMENEPSKPLGDILEQENPDQVSIVFFDDIIQSGKQARTIFQEWFGLKTDLNEPHVRELNANQKERFKKFHVYLLFAYGFKRGIENIEVLLKKELKFGNCTIKAFYYNHPTEKCFHPTSSIFYDPEDRLNAEKMCREIGYNLFLDKEHWSKEKRCVNSLGYGNEQGLFITFWNVPTTTLPILWKRGNHNDKLWEPLFLRRAKK